MLKRLFTDSNDLVVIESIKTLTKLCGAKLVSKVRCSDLIAVVMSYVLYPNKLIINEIRKLIACLALVFT